MTEEIKEGPILFTGAMVRALLDGSKTQTRRVVKGQSAEWDYFSPEDDVAGREFFMVCGEPEQRHPSLRPILKGVACPYGQAGDRLWVRETWGVISNDWDDDGSLTDWIPNRPATEISELPFGKGYYSGHAIYAADGPYEWAGDDDGGGEPRSAWHPSIHMPRAVSRILLEIVSVRVERLQDIGVEEIEAEGVVTSDEDIMQRGCRARVIDFTRLWDGINGAGAWDANPWVWVVEFKRVAP